MSEDQWVKLIDGNKEIQLEIKLLWSKLNEIGITMAKLPCEQHSQSMKHSSKDIDKHINESDDWRRMIVGAFIGSIASLVIAVSIFVTTKVTLEKHIEYSNKYFAHIEGSMK